jgi:hypothetical protein
VGVGSRAWSRGEERLQFSLPGLESCFDVPGSNAACGAAGVSAEMADLCDENVEQLSLRFGLLGVHCGFGVGGCGHGELFL